MEKNYQFKTDLLQIHQRDRRDLSLKPDKNEFELFEGIKIHVCEKALASDSDSVIMTAVRDFEDYLFTSMGIGAGVTRSKDADLKISLNSDLGDASGYMGYRITVTADGITLEGYDVRGVAQGLYYMEDMMNIRRAPFLTHGTTARKAMFSPRTCQSPFGMFEYHDAALSIIAHMGFDTIDMWMKDAHTTKRGDFYDLNLLSQRAAKYGLDVSVGNYALHDRHPDDEGAKEYYEKMYGDFFEAAPRIKYITLVGEATNFPSRDPRVGKSPYMKNFEDNIPTGKTSPGWFPCEDYPRWVEMIQNAIHKFNPGAQLIFSTYNWGFGDDKDRVKLVENLPEGVAICSTWDMFHQRKIGNSVEDIVDYSLSFAGPGKPFVSEALAAKRRGVKLHTNSQTAGRTWDFGVIPYEPMPGQWIKRYEGMQKAYREWNLCGVRETIHYAFHPSFITELEKYAFFTGAGSLTEHLEKLIKRDHAHNADKVSEALKCFDEAITHYIPTNEDQYGAYRIGPAYPLWLEEVNGMPASLPEGGRQPNRNQAMFGNGIYFPVYTPEVLGRNSLPGVRIHDEINEAYIMRDCMKEGIDILEACESPTPAHIKLLNLAKFIYHCVLTTINVKKHYLLKQQISIAGTHQKGAELIDEVEKLLLEERENVNETIPLVQFDSRLGWEPSMEYTTDEKGLRWKLRQLDHELNVILPKFRKSNGLIKEFE
ncbi:MAG: hypothetical protein E7588_06635 [Ruminococcaceae bacterium]|nr:hypothetical protein [Oscillospiraceae bacterium]